MSPFFEQLEEAVYNNHVEMIDLILATDKTLAVYGIGWALDLDHKDALECVVNYLPPTYPWQEALEKATLHCSIDLLKILLPYATRPQKLDMLDIAAVEGNMEKVEFLLPTCLPMTLEERNWDYATPSCKYYIETMVLSEQEKKTLNETLPKTDKPPRSHKI